MNLSDYLSPFILNHYNAWEEDGRVHLTTEYCEYGNLLNFFKQLEASGVVLTEDFFWDLFFQMFCVYF